MPRKGFKSITVKEELAHALGDIADKMGKSVPEALQIIVDGYQEKGD